MNKLFITRVSLVVALGGFLMGFDASVISGVVKFVETEFGLSKLQLGWVVSCLTLTATLAMMVAGPLSDRFGRIVMLKTAAVLFTVSAVLSALAPSFWMLVIARMIGGFGVGAALILAPMYIAEISPGALRGRMVSLNQLNIVVGISVAFFSNFFILKLGAMDAAWTKALAFDAYTWRWMLGLETLPAVFYFFALMFVPESPRWLIMNNRRDEGQTILAKASGEQQAAHDVKEIMESMSTADQLGKVPLSELFKPALRLVLTIGIVIAILQQISGINAVFFYAPMIFEQSGIGTNAAFWQATLVGLANLVFTVVAIVLIDKIGRKPLLSMGLIGIALCMFVIAYGFGNAQYTLTPAAIEGIDVSLDKSALMSMADVAYDSDIEFKQAITQALGPQDALKYQSELITAAISINPLVILVGILGFVASFAMSLGPVMWVLFSELFPNRLRGVAISFAGFINSAVSFSVQQFFPWELENFGNAITFLIFGVFSAVGLFYVLAKVPETKGKTLEQLEKELVKG